MVFKLVFKQPYGLKNLCSLCTYKLEDEEPLKFVMLYTIDGNDSLKRIICHEAAPKESHSTKAILGKSSESTNTTSGNSHLALAVFGGSLNVFTRDWS